MGCCAGELTLLLRTLSTSESHGHTGADIRRSLRFQKDRETSDVGRNCVIYDGFSGPCVAFKAGRFSKMNAVEIEAQLKASNYLQKWVD